MRLWRRLLTVLLACLCVFSFTACTKDSVDGGFDDEGNYKPSDKGTVLSFWGWGDDVEGRVFNKLTSDFNKTIGKQNNIEVEYNKIPSTSYDTNVQLALQSTNTPDIVYVGDGSVKQWAEKGWLTRLDDPENNFLTRSGGMDIDAMWPSAVNRYRYNVQTTTSNSDDPLWGLPKDIGPTVIYYNADYVRNAGVTIISVSEEEMKEKDLFGKSIPNTDGKTYSWRGYDDEQKVFNNKIAMNWEETVALAQLISQKNSKCDYGYFTEWWFNYGWSVGGDCMEYVTDEQNKPYYKFTLGDETKNYIVKDEYNGELTVSGGGYL